MGKSEVFNPLDPSGNYVPPALTINKSTVFPQYIYGFSTILRINSDYFLKQR
jgi:hypothetical protein